MTDKISHIKFLIFWLFIDAGYAFGMPWNESYYLFEYDEQSIKLIRKIRASSWGERLRLSDHFKKKFKVTETELSNIIKKF